ncbi:Winged helix-turn-helix transcriptional regulator, partial [Dysosmobacter welbionis]
LAVQQRHRQHHQVAHQEGHNDQVGHVRALREQGGACHQTMDGQCADKQRGSGVARDAKAQQRHHGAGHHCIVGSLGSSNALPFASAELFLGMDALFHVIGREDSHSHACAGHATQQVADCGGTQPGRQQLTASCPGGEGHLVLGTSMDLMLRLVYHL